MDSAADANINNTGVAPVPNKADNIAIPPDLAPTNNVEPPPIFEPAEVTNSAPETKATLDHPALLNEEPRRSTRVRQPCKSYQPSFSSTKYLYAMMYLSLIELASEQSFNAGITAHVMTQLSLKQPLKVWGKEAHQAVDSEI